MIAFVFNKIIVSANELHLMQHGTAFLSRFAVDSLLQGFTAFNAPAG